jgi:hypothetical protein
MGSIILIIMFVLIIMSMTYVSCAPMPYYADTIFQKHGMFEGFGTGMLNYAQKDTYAAMDNTKQYLITPAPTAAKKIHGFNGLYGSPTELINPLDKFASAEGKLDCHHGYGLSNSMGTLCLSADQVELLRTRGGNVNNIDSANDAI